MDKDVVHIYIVEYYSAVKKKKKEWNAISSNMDATRDYHTKLSQKEKDKYHMLSRGESKIYHKWAYLRNRNRITDTENRLVATKGLEERQSGRLGFTDVSF